MKETNKKLILKRNIPTTFYVIVILQQNNNLRIIQLIMNLKHISSFYCIILLYHALLRIEIQYMYLKVDSTTCKSYNNY